VDKDGNLGRWDQHLCSPDGTYVGSTLSTSALTGGARAAWAWPSTSRNNVWASTGSGHASKFTRRHRSRSFRDQPVTYLEGRLPAADHHARHGTGARAALATDAQWDSVQWSGSLAQDDTIAVRVRSAALETDFTDAYGGWSPYHNADPALAPPWSAVIRGEVPDHRWLQLEVTLETQDENSPAFTDLRIFWQR
jgi:hypothetical protein